MQIGDFDLVDTEVGLDVSALPAQGWLPAVVPGGVHESLLAVGRIAHPYQDRNEHEIRWIEERDWWFRASFAGPAAGGRARLVFHGLDTVADIWLNGDLLGQHENMFRPAEFDVTGKLRDRNELLLRFSPPLRGILDERGTTATCFFTGSFGAPMHLVAGTSMVTLAQSRLYQALGASYGLRAIPLEERLTLTETMYWPPSHIADPAHTWLRSKISDVAASL